MSDIDLESLAAMERAANFPHHHGNILREALQKYVERMTENISSLTEAGAEHGEFAIVGYCGATRLAEDFQAQRARAEQALKELGVILDGEDHDDEDE